MWNRVQNLEGFGLNSEPAGSRTQIEHRQKDKTIDLKNINSRMEQQIGHRRFLFLHIYNFVCVFEFVLWSPAPGDDGPGERVEPQRRPGREEDAGEAERLGPIRGHY